MLEKNEKPKGNGQNYCTQAGPTTLQTDRWSLLKRWCLVCIAPTLSGVETKLLVPFF